MKFRFDGTKVLLLVENPQDALKIILGGIKTTTINIGLLSFDSSKKMICDTVAVNQRDIKTFIAIHNQGITLKIQQVSSDIARDLWKLLQNKKLIS